MSFGDCVWNTILAAYQLVLTACANYNLPARLNVHIMSYNLYFQFYRASYVDCIKHDDAQDGESLR